jgi:GH24 family phage-related lysozyme (muramidase)
LKEFEGCVSWMYRDTVGKVTVGVGLMLPDTEAAEALPFVLGTRAASRKEIATEYARVDGMALGHASAFYKIPTSLELTQQTINAKLKSMLEGFEAELRIQFPRYDALPDGAKMALLDMIYNLGAEGLFKGFPHLVAAVKAEAWAQAAQHCIRRGPSAARNAWTQQQFLSAVVDTIKAETENWLTRIWWRIRLIWNGLFRLSS